MYKDTWCTYFLMWDSKFLRHPRRLVDSPGKGACGEEGTRSSSDWSSGLMLSHACCMPPLLMSPWPLSQTSCTFHSFFNTSRSRLKWLLWSELGKQWILRWRWKRFWQVYSICLPLSCIGYFNLTLISTWLWELMYRRFFFRYARTFHRWTF